MTEEEINYAKNNEELKLSLWETIRHYQIAGFLFLIPITLLIVNLEGYLTGTIKTVEIGLIALFLIPLLVGILFFFKQKKALQFKIISSKLSREQLQNIVNQVAKELEWELTINTEACIIAKTHPGFLSGSWGEQITILFDKNRVLINSICDPDKRSSVFSMGRNKQNVSTFINLIKQG